MKIPLSSRQRGIVMSIVGFNLFQSYNFRRFKQPFAIFLQKKPRFYLNPDGKLSFFRESDLR